MKEKKFRVKLAKWIIKVLLSGYSLHRNPPKGRKKRGEIEDATST